MATSLCSALALAALLQAPPGTPLAGAPPVESLAALRAQVGRDSADGRAWLLLGRAYLRRVDEAHGPPDRAVQDSVWARTALDTAERALARAAGLLDSAGSAAESDSARVLRVGAWSERARLAWEVRGTAAGPQEWGPVPLDLKLPPVLDELGENLLRVCPMWGVLFTAGEADSYAAWYMRFARGLRPDLLVMPLAVWRSDSALRTRVAADLKLGRRRDGDDELAEIARHRPVCISMGFERAPEPRPRIKWATRPLLWVGGPEREGDRVPPRDFVFAALRMALDEHEAWAEPALALYARAAHATPALCEALATFKVANQVASCRK